MREDRMLYTVDVTRLCRRIRLKLVGLDEVARRHAALTILFPGGEWAEKIRGAILEAHGPMALEKAMQWSSGLSNMQVDRWYTRTVWEKPDE